MTVFLRCRFSFGFGAEAEAIETDLRGRKIFGPSFIVCLTPVKATPVLRVVEGLNPLVCYRLGLATTKWTFPNAKWSIINLAFGL